MRGARCREKPDGGPGRGGKRGEGAGTLGNLYNYPPRSDERSRRRRRWVTLRGGRGHTHRSGEPPRARRFLRHLTELLLPIHPFRRRLPSTAVQATAACLQCLPRPNVYACIKTTPDSAELPISPRQDIIRVWTDLGLRLAATFPSSTLDTSDTGLPGREDV